MSQDTSVSLSVNNCYRYLFSACVRFAIKWWAWTDSFYISNSHNRSSYGFDHLLYWTNALRAFQTQKKSDRKHSTSCKSGIAYNLYFTICRVIRKYAYLMIETALALIMV